MAHFYISRGDTNAMFTLRKSWVEPVQYGNTFRRVKHDVHVQNLANDEVRARAKAQEIADAVGFPLTAEISDMPLRSITRRSHEEMEAERTAQVEYFLKMRAERETELLALVAEGKIPFGWRKGDEIAKTPMGYLNWVVSEDFEANSEVAKAFRAKVAEYLATLPVKVSRHQGNVGERITFTAKVMKVMNFGSYVYGAPARYMTLLEDEEGNVFKMVGVYLAEVGKTITVTATVKEHSEYNDNAQTVIQRPKVK
jgi:hypothetical protein